MPPTRAPARKLVNTLAGLEHSATDALRIARILPGASKLRHNSSYLQGCDNWGLFWRVIVYLPPANLQHFSTTEPTFHTAMVFSTGLATVSDVVAAPATPSAGKTQIPIILPLLKHDAPSGHTSSEMHSNAQYLWPP